MALQTVYDENGTPFTVEPIDAREYVKSGAYTYEAPVKKEETQKETAPTRTTKKKGESETEKTPEGDKGAEGQQNGEGQAGDQLSLDNQNGSN